jgi:hypothetical protein
LKKRPQVIAGDVRAAGRRLAALESIPLLDVTDEAVLLAGRLVRDGGLPQKAYVDAFHVSIATVHGVDYLLTWNCKHIANASLRGKVEAISRAAGYQPTTIFTPFEMPKDWPMEPKDPIIDELHAIREAIAAASGNDVNKIAESMRARQSNGNREVVSLPAKRIAEKQAS